MTGLIIQNCEAEDAGLYEQASGFDVFHAYRDASWPDPGRHDAVIVLGTPLAAYRVHEHDFLRREWLFLEEVIASGRACLGVCFGAQILARLLRGRVFPAPVREIGGGEVRLTRPGIEDPLFAGCSEKIPVFQWHGDTFDLPPGSTLLAEGDACPNQAFRHGRVVGLQFHLEVTADQAARWADAYADELREHGKTRDEIVAECAALEDRMRPLARSLIAGFLESGA